MENFRIRRRWCLATRRLIPLYAGIALAITPPLCADLFHTACDTNGCGLPDRVIASGEASAVADLDDDGVVDAVVAHWSRSVIEWWQLNIDQPCLVQTLPVNRQVTDLLLVDFDGDRRLETIVASDGLAQVLALGSGGLLQLVEEVRPSNGTNLVATGDFNGDGRVDLALLGRTVEVAFGTSDGLGFFARPLIPPGLANVGSTWQLVAEVTDFNDDGIADLVVAGEIGYPPVNEGTLWFAAGSADGRFSIASRHRVGSYPTSVGVATTSGDRIASISVASVGSNRVSLFESVGRGGPIISQERVDGSPIWTYRPVGVAAVSSHLLVFDVSNPTPIALPLEYLLDRVAIEVYGYEWQLVGNPPPLQRVAVPLPGMSLGPATLLAGLPGMVPWDGLLVLYDPSVDPIALATAIDSLADASVRGFVPELGLLVLDLYAVRGTDVWPIAYFAADLIDQIEALDPGKIRVEGDARVGTRACGPFQGDPFRHLQWFLDELRVAEGRDLAGQLPVDLVILDGWLEPGSADGIPAEPPVLGLDVSSAEWAGRPPLRGLVGGPAGGSSGRGADAHARLLAEIVAAESCNGQGIEGVVPGPNVDWIPVLDPNGLGLASRVAYGLVMTAQEGADVANLSLGTSTGSEVLRRAVAYASANRVAVIAAAGNRANPYRCDLPAAADGALCIAGTDENRMPTRFTNGHADVASPAVAIPGADGRTHNGTSAAAAIVAGLPLLMLSTYAELAVDDLYGLIEEHAQPIAGCAGVDPPTLCLAAGAEELRPRAPSAPMSASSAISPCSAHEIVGHGTIDFALTMQAVSQCAAGGGRGCHVGHTKRSSPIVVVELVAAIETADRIDLYVGSSGFMSTLVESLELR